MTTLKDFMSKQKEAATRKQKRQAKAETLWPHYQKAKPLFLFERPKKARRAPSEWKKQRDRCDHWAGMIAKTRDKRRGLCRICGRSPVYCAYHILSRAYFAIRFDLLNIVGACSDCNWWEKKTRQQAPLQVEERHDKIFGEEYMAELKRKSRIKLAKLDAAQLEELAGRLKRMYETFLLNKI